MNAVLGKEAHLEAALAAPPHRFRRTGHVDHGDHVAHLQVQLVPSLIETPFATLFPCSRNVAYLRDVASHAVSGSNGGRVDRAAFFAGHKQPMALVVHLQPVEHRAAVDRVVRDAGEASQVLDKQGL